MKSIIIISVTQYDDFGEIRKVTQMHAAQLHIHCTMFSKRAHSQIYLLMQSETSRVGIAVHRDKNTETTA